MPHEIKFEVDPIYDIEKPESPEVGANMFEYLRSIYKPNKIFKKINQDWHDSFSKDNVSDIIKTLQSGKDSRNVREQENYMKELRNLKELRRVGNRLIDVWKLLDHNHKPPKLLKHFVSSVGKYQDTVTLLGREERDPLEMIESARALREASPKSFSAASFLSFYGSYAEQIENIEEILESGIPTLENHHELRKSVRTLRNFYRLVSSVTGNADARLLANFLAPVSVEMGKTQDLIFVMKQEGKVDLKTDVTRIRDKHQRILYEFIGLHSRY